MSLYDYEMSRNIEMQEYPFYGLIMAAMRQADNGNVEKLKAAFPDVWEELYGRYRSPGGVLPEDSIPIRYEVRVT